MNTTRKYDPARREFCTVSQWGSCASRDGARHSMFVVQYDGGEVLAAQPRSYLPKLQNVIQVGKRNRASCQTTAVVGVWRINERKCLALIGYSQEVCPTKWAGFLFRVLDGVDEPLSEPVRGLKVKGSDAVEEIRGLPGAPSVLKFALYFNPFTERPDPSIYANCWKHDGITDPFTCQARFAGLSPERAAFGKVGAA